MVTGQGGLSPSTKLFYFSDPRKEKPPLEALLFPRRVSLQPGGGEKKKTRVELILDHSKTKSKIFLNKRVWVQKIKKKLHNFPQNTLF